MYTYTQEYFCLYVHTFNCVYTYTVIYICIHICNSLCIYAYTKIDVCTCIHIQLHIFICINRALQQTHTYLSLFMCILTFIWPSLCMNIHTHVYVYIYSYDMYTHILSHVPIFMYICKHKCQNLFRYDPVHARAWLKLFSFYSYISIYSCTYIFVYVFAGVWLLGICICICIHFDVFVYIFVYICSFVYIYTSICTSGFWRMGWCALSRTCIVQLNCVHMPVYMCTHIYACTYSSVFVYTSICICRSLTHGTMRALSNTATSTTLPPLLAQPSMYRFEKI